MPEFFSSDGSFLLQFVVIFLVILVLLMGAVLLFRRLVGRGLSLSARAAKTGRQPRLGIVDIYELDRHRQLILLRRDNVEHLLLVGGPNDVVVERNVQRGARLPNEGLLRSEVDPEPEIEHPHALGEPPPESPPTFEMPVVVPPPLPGSRNQAAIQAPSLDPKLFEGDESEAAPQPQAFTRPRVGRLLRRTPPPLVEPRPEPASERPPGVPPVMAAGDPRPVDPAVLSDMARQLEVALRRPSSAVTPPPAQAASEPAAPPAPEPGASEPCAPPRVADPVAAGMAATQVLNPAPPTPAKAAPPPAEPAKPPAPPAAPVKAPAPPAQAAKMDAVPQAATAPAPTPPGRPQPSAPAPKPAPTAADKEAARETDPVKREAAPEPPPFSVEEIEAEFARLLGRPVDRKP